MTKKKQSYTDSIYYQIKLASRYMKIFATQLFEEVQAEISFEEFIALDVVNDSKSMCQRDLAKLLLKDRANTGRIADGLKNKGYIEINISLKGNRPIKEIVLTEKGKNTPMNRKPSARLSHRRQLTGWMKGAKLEGRNMLMFLAPKPVK